MGDKDGKQIGLKIIRVLVTLEDGDGTFPIPIPAGAKMVGLVCMVLQNAGATLNYTANIKSGFSTTTGGTGIVRDTAGDAAPDGVKIFCNVELQRA